MNFYEVTSKFPLAVGGEDVGHSTTQSLPSSMITPARLNPPSLAQRIYATVWLPNSPAPRFPGSSAQGNGWQTYATLH